MMLASYLTALRLISSTRRGKEVRCEGKKKKTFLGT
jgi:hypothetical protein